MIKISGCLFWLQSTLFKSCFSDVADFLRREGGDAGSPSSLPCAPTRGSVRTDVLVPSAARAGLRPALSSRVPSECSTPRLSSTLTNPGGLHPRQRWHQLQHPRHLKFPAYLTTQVLSLIITIRTLPPSQRVKCKQ